MAGSPTFLGDGHASRRDDTQWAIQQKILGALNDGGGGGGGTVPTTAGFVIRGHGAPSGAPSTIDATYSDSKPWTYYDLDDNNRIYAWTGSIWN